MITFSICEGNPGALTFLCDAYNQNPGMAETAFQRALRDGITGDKLYMVWNDCCNRNTLKAIDVLVRKSSEDLREHINYAHGRGIPYDE